MLRSFALILPLAALAGGALAAGSAAPDRANGKQVWDHWCAPCHARGPGHPGTQSLQIKYHGTPPAALKDRTDLTPGITAMYVRQGIDLMPFFRKTEVSDKDLRDLSAYLDKGK